MQELQGKLPQPQRRLLVQRLAILGQHRIVSRLLAAPPQQPHPESPKDHRHDLRNFLAEVQDLLTGITPALG